MNLRKFIQEAFLSSLNAASEIQETEEKLHSIGSWTTEKRGMYKPVPGLRDWYIQRHEGNWEGDYWKILKSWGRDEKLMGELYDDGKLILYPLQDIPTDENPTPHTMHPELVGHPFQAAMLVWLQKRKPNKKRKPQLKSK